MGTNTVRHEGSGAKVKVPRDDESDVEGDEG